MYKDDIKRILLEGNAEHGGHVDEGRWGNTCGKTEVDCITEKLCSYISTIIKPIEEDEECSFCKRLTNSFSCNPTEWPLKFPDNDGTGKVKSHHVGCVTSRLFNTHVR